MTDRTGVETGGFTFRPVTPETLGDLALFAETYGKFGYCSCMRWRLTSSEFRHSDKASRSQALLEAVTQGVPIGVLAYQGQAPVGWCSIAPRSSYAGLERYRAIPRVDEQPVWAVACFFVAASARRRGLTVGLLKAAVTYAEEQGAHTVEGYPVPSGARLYTYMGSPATFRAAGFSDVTPPGSARLVMRLTIAPETRHD